MEPSVATSFKRFRLIIIYGIKNNNLNDLFPENDKIHNKLGLNGAKLSSHCYWASLQFYHAKIFFYSQPENSGPLCLCKKPANLANKKLMVKLMGNS